MALMLTCLKKKDYDESRCAKEVQNYLGCHEKFVVRAPTPDICILFFL